MLHSDRRVQWVCHGLLELECVVFEGALLDLLLGHGQLLSSVALLHKPVNQVHLVRVTSPLQLSVVLVLLLGLAFSLDLLVDHHLVEGVVQLGLLLVHFLGFLLECASLLLISMENTLQLLLESNIFVSILVNVVHSIVFLLLLSLLYALLRIRMLDDDLSHDVDRVFLIVLEHAHLGLLLL